MKESTATDAARHAGIPAGNPMNLTCTTITSSPAGDTPSQVMIVVFNNGAPPAPPAGWNTFLPANANTEYEVDFNGNSQRFNGSGVAIYYK